MILNQFLLEKKEHDIMILKPFFFKKLSFTNNLLKYHDMQQIKSRDGIGNTQVQKMRLHHLGDFWCL